MSGHEIRTERLRLRLLPGAEVRALLDGLGSPGIPWADGYPMEGSLVAAALHAGLADEGVEAGHFGIYQLVLRDTGAVIGDIGFHAPPDGHGDATVGFAVVPAERRRGYAREALEGLLGWALGRPEVRLLRCEADGVDHASCRTLERAGMRLVAEAADRRTYEIRDAR